MTDATPSQIAQFDQIWTETNRELDTLIATHREVRAEAVNSREIDLGHLCQWLMESADPVALAGLLTGAIDRLASIDPNDSKETP